MRSNVRSVMIAMALLVAAAPTADAQARREPPGRGGPPRAAEPEKADVSAFKACYEADGFPEIAVVVLPGQDRDRFTNDDLIYIDAFESELQRALNGVDVRMPPNARAANLQGAAFEALLRDRNWLGAAGFIADQMNCKRVFMITLIPRGKDARGATRFQGRYDIVNTVNQRMIDGRQFPAAFSGMGPADNGNLPRNLGRVADQVARELIRGYVENHCGGVVGNGGREDNDNGGDADTRKGNGGGGAIIAPGNQGPPEEAFLGVARDMDVRIIGEFGRRDVDAIMGGIRGYEYLKHVIGAPRIEDNAAARFVEMKVKAFGEPALVGSDLSFAVFLATGKDSRIARADETQVVLEVLDPARTRWLGPEDERNRELRRHLKSLYNKNGRPPIAVVTRQVVGQDRRYQNVVAINWWWFHAFRFDLWEDAGDNRAYAGDALARGLFNRLTNVGLDSADAQAVFEFNADPEMSADQLKRPGTLERVLADQGFELICDGRGEVSRALQETQISFGFNVRSIANGINYAATNTGARIVPNGGLVAGEFTNSLADELAAQLVDQLYNRWSDGVERMQIVLIDAKTVAESDNIRKSIERDIEGVEYTAFRSVGSQGQIIEVGLSNPRSRDAVRSALTNGDWDLTFLIVDGSTPSRFRVQLTD